MSRRRRMIVIKSPRDWPRLIANMAGSPRPTQCNDLRPRPKSSILFHRDKGPSPRPSLSSTQPMPSRVAGTPTIVECRAAIQVVKRCIIAYSNCDVIT